MHQVCASGLTRKEYLSPNRSHTVFFLYGSLSCKWYFQKEKVKSENFRINYLEKSSQRLLPMFVFHLIVSNQLRFSKIYLWSKDFPKCCRPVSSEYFQMCAELSLSSVHFRLVTLDSALRPALGLVSNRSLWANSWCLDTTWG